MKTSTLCILFCLLSSLVFGQTQTASKPDNRFLYRNSVQFEAGGHGIAYAINYERNLLNHTHFKTSVQLGFSFYPKPIDIQSRLWIPLSFNQLFSFRQHHIEAGLGMVFTQFQNSGSDGDMYHEARFEPLLSGKVGYRYQKPQGRMQYKVLFTPLLEKSFGNYDLYPLGALSIGYSF